MGSHGAYLLISARVVKKSPPPSQLLGENLKHHAQTILAGTVKAVDEA